MGVQQPLDEQSAASFRALRDEVLTSVESSEAPLCLLCRAHSLGCALPLSHVVETMRPLPTIPIPGTPSFVQGLAIIRGSPSPVIELSRLLGAPSPTSTRFVSIRTDRGTLALAVEHVEGLRSIATASLQALPPLLQGMQSDSIAAVTLLDERLLLMMRTARLVPEGVWAALSIDPRGQG